MKRGVLIALILIALGLISEVFLSRERGVQAVDIKMNLKDIPEYRITLIGPSDPSFKDKVSSFLKGRAHPLLEAMKPYSVLLSNTSDKAIVAYKLKWECLKVDGQIIVKQIEQGNPGALMDGGGPGLEYLSTTQGNAIKPGSTRFIAPSFSLGEDEESGMEAYAGGTQNKSEVDQLKQASQNGDITTMVKHIAVEWRDYVSVAVTIDGVFFEDGRFVGPDTTNFFANFRAGIDAKQDLLQEIRFAIDKKLGETEIFNDVERWANSRDNDASPNKMTPTDYYNSFKKTYAQEILRMKEVMGTESTITAVLAPLRKQWPTLRKIR